MADCSNAGHFLLYNFDTDQQLKALQPLTTAQMKKIMGGAAAAKYLCADRIFHVFRCYATKLQCLAGCPTPSACTPSTLCV
jgi:hypothetical protein